MAILSFFFFPPNPQNVAFQVKRDRGDPVNVWLQIIFKITCSPFKSFNKRAAVEESCFEKQLCLAEEFQHFCREMDIEYVWRMPPLCITGKFLIEYFSLAKLESLWNLTARISVGAELASWPSNKLPFYGFMFELRANICIPRNQAVEPSMRASRDHTNLVVLENGANGPGTKFWKPFPKAKVKEETVSMCSVDAHLPSSKVSPVTICRYRQVTRVRSAHCLPKAFQLRSGFELSSV